MLYNGPRYASTQKNYPFHLGIWAHLTHIFMVPRESIWHLDRFSRFCTNRQTEAHRHKGTQTTKETLVT